MITAIIAFVVTMLLMTLTGVLSARHKKHTSEDYLIASQNVKPWLSAQSTADDDGKSFRRTGTLPRLMTFLPDDFRSVPRVGRE